MIDDAGDGHDGWGWGPNSRKAHYFTGGLSLCRRWGYVGPLTQNQEGSRPDDCAECTRRLAKLRASLAEKGAER